MIGRCQGRIMYNRCTDTGLRMSRRTPHGSHRMQSIPQHDIIQNWSAGEPPLPCPMLVYPIDVVACVGCHTSCAMKLLRPRGTSPYQILCDSFCYHKFLFRGDPVIRLVLPCCRRGNLSPELSSSTLMAACLDASIFLSTLDPYQ